MAFLKLVFNIGHLIRTSETFTVKTFIMFELFFLFFVSTFATVFTVIYTTLVNKNDTERIHLAELLQHCRQGQRPVVVGQLVEGNWQESALNSPTIGSTEVD